MGGHLKIHQINYSHKFKEKQKSCYQFPSKWLSANEYDFPFCFPIDFVFFFFLSCHFFLLDFGTIETERRSGRRRRWWRRRSTSIRAEISASYWYRERCCRRIAGGGGGDGRGGDAGAAGKDGVRGSQASQRTQRSGSDPQILRPDLCKWSWIVQSVVCLVDYVKLKKINK